MNFREYLSEAKGPQKVSVVLKNLQKKFDSEPGPFGITKGTAGANGTEVTVLNDLQVVKDGNTFFVPFMMDKSYEDYGGAEKEISVTFYGLMRKGKQPWKVDYASITSNKEGVAKSIAALKGAKTFTLPDQNSKKLMAAITKGRKIKDSMFPKWMKNIEPKMVEKLGMI